jgi:hypothetical protein
MAADKTLKRFTMARLSIRGYLAGGDRRSLGRAQQLIQLLEKRPEHLPELIREMWNPDPTIAMRAADAAEKLTRKQAQALQPFKRELLGLAEETRQRELRWHLAAMIPRLRLRPPEQSRFIRVLTQYLGGKSSIVKTFALQALFDLSESDAALRPQIEELLQKTVHEGTPAMRARSRKLLKQIEKGTSPLTSVLII